MIPTFQLQNCPVFLGALAEAFPAWLKAHQYSQIFILADKHTNQHCLPIFIAQAGFETNPTLTIIPAGENAKNLSTCEAIWKSMLRASMDRKSLVINLGGGVIGDMGGFCAATWKRGLDFVQIPTTLLSMTDAAIGGKTGIDFYGIKNSIGFFQQPAAVFVDPQFLHTLPESEMTSGVAEVLKHALIGDPALKDEINTQLKISKNLYDFDWMSLLQKSIAVKVHVVEKDPHEKGLRMLLNFGHSIGHAIESCFLEKTNPLSHGEAIFIGMICEAFLDNRLLILDQLNSWGQALFNQQTIMDTDLPLLWEIMQQDKKNSSGNVRMAVPDEEPYSLKILELQKHDLARSLEYYNMLGPQLDQTQH